MTIVKLAAVFSCALLVSSSLSFAADGQPFPLGTWGQTAKHCALFSAGSPADAIQITPTERSYRESEGQLVGAPIVSITQQANGRFRIVTKTDPASSQTTWEDVWTTDKGRTLLAQSQDEPSSVAPRKYVACKEKPAPAPASTGKWQFDLNPDTPHATLDPGSGVPKIEMFCAGDYTFNYRFTLPNGEFPKSISFPNVDQDLILPLDRNGVLSARGNDSFMAQIEGLIEEAKRDGSTEPESSFVTQLGFDKGDPIPVPLGSLKAVWAKLKPLCPNARIDLFPPEPTQKAISVPVLKEPLPGSGQVSLSCDVTSRNTSNVGNILVSIDMNRGAYAIINPVSHAVSGVFGMISVDSAYRLQTASPMGLLLIDRQSGQLTNYPVSELMGADNKGFCAPAPSYVPFP